MWCIKTIDSEFRERMYNVLDLYEEDYGSKTPFVCLDEKTKQLIDDKITPIPMKPGSPEKYDYEYVRQEAVSDDYGSIRPLSVWGVSTVACVLG